jgi:hypothetical protein
MKNSSVVGVPEEIVTKFFEGNGIEPAVADSSGSARNGLNSPENAQWVAGLGANAGMKVNKGYFSEYMCAVNLKLENVWPMNY